MSEVKTDYTAEPQTAAAIDAISELVAAFLHTKPERPQVLCLAGALAGAMTGLFYATAVSFRDYSAMLDIATREIEKARQRHGDTLGQAGSHRPKP